MVGDDDDDDAALACVKNEKSGKLQAIAIAENAHMSASTCGNSTANWQPFNTIAYARQELILSR